MSHDDTTSENDAWRAAGDRALVEGMRRREPAAIDEFARRFEDTALRYAHYFRVPRAEQADWALDALHDVALTLAQPAGPTPDTLRAYVIGACRHRALRERDAAQRHAARVREAQIDIGWGELVVQGAMSASALRAARGPGSDPGDEDLPPVFADLLAVLDRDLSADERMLLTLLANDTSYTSVAAHFGITRPAAVSRIQRLRRRLIAAAYDYACALPDVADRLRLGRFLQRSGKGDASRLAPAARSTPSLTPEASR